MKDKQKKRELLLECARTLQKLNVEKWYNEHLDKKPQAETINTLLNGIVEGHLTTKEALQIALIVGVQWNVKFE